MSTEEFVAWSTARSLQAIPRRLRLAFPQLTILFPLLSVGRTRGEPWRPVLDAYTDPMSDTQVVRLAREMADLFALGVTDAQFGALCQALGLDDAVARKEGETTYRFVATVEERVSGERIDRLGHSKVA